MFSCSNKSPFFSSPELQQNVGTTCWTNIIRKLISFFFFPLCSQCLCYLGCMGEPFLWPWEGFFWRQEQMGLFSLVRWPHSGQHWRYFSWTWCKCWVCLSSPPPPSPPPRWIMIPSKVQRLIWLWGEVFLQCEQWEMGESIPAPVLMGSVPVQQIDLVWFSVLPFKQSTSYSTGRNLSLCGDFSSLCLTLQSSASRNASNFFS